MTLSKDIYVKDKVIKGFKKKNQRQFFSIFSEPGSSRFFSAFSEFFESPNF